MLNPQNLAPGCERSEEYTSNRKTLVQYDYRHTDGELFSCVKKTLEDCRASRDAWLQKKEAQG